MTPLHDKIDAYIKEFDRGWLAKRAGVSLSVIKCIEKNDSSRKHRRVILDRLYEFFRLPEDDWYRENVRRWIRPTDSAMGTALRLRRCAMGLSTAMAARLLVCGEQQIVRIETGETISSYRGVFGRMLALYEFSPADRSKLLQCHMRLSDVRSLCRRLVRAESKDMEKTTSTARVSAASPK